MTGEWPQRPSDWKRDGQILRWAAANDVHHATIRPVECADGETRFRLHSHYGETGDWWWQVYAITELIADGEGIAISIGEAHDAVKQAVLGEISKLEQRRAASVERSERRAQDIADFFGD